MKFVNLDSIPKDIKSDVEMRHKTLENCVHSGSIIFRLKDKPIGHLKLWLLSRKARDLVISDGQISLAGQTYKVVLPNPLKDVLRCLKCQRYGHTVKWCKSADTCGTCAGSHSTKACTSAESIHKCANCIRTPGRTNSSSVTHRAGHHDCPHHLAAVDRYKKTFCML